MNELVEDERLRQDAERLTEVERERDILRKHFDASIDARARVVVLERMWAAVHEALGIRPDGLAGILGAIEELKGERGDLVRWLETDEMNWRGNDPVLEQPQALAERIERGEHRK